MQKEKIAAIILVVIIVVALFAYIGAKENLFGNLFGSKTKEVELGDCVDLYYTGKFANGTIFDSSYQDPENKINGTLFNVYVTKNSTATPPAGYDDYRAGMIEGFIDGIVGLKEGQETTIGPIPPEKAYGRPPEIGDEITFSFPGAKAQVLVIRNITYNAPMPSDFVSEYGNINTTILSLRSKVELGEKTTLYYPWENDTEYVFINETTAILRTTPSDDKMSNFTWVNETLSVQYWENASSVISINDTTIVIQHNPEPGDTAQGYYYIYTVVNISSDKINCSYQELDTGNTSYILFDRVEEIQRNETQVILFDLPIDDLESTVLTLVNYYGINVDYPFSFSDLAGETLYFDIVLEKIYKTSES